MGWGLGGDMWGLSRDGWGKVRAWQQTVGATRGAFSASGSRERAATVGRLGMHCLQCWVGLHSVLLGFAGPRQEGKGGGLRHKFGPVQSRFKQCFNFFPILILFPNFEIQVIGAITEV